jgi:hypothetical protein
MTGSAATLRFARALEFMALFWLANATVVQGAGGTFGPFQACMVPRRCCREYWIVNTRQAPVCDDLENGFDRINYWKYDNFRGWIRYSREEFVAAMDPSLPTTFFVHGSFLSDKGAVTCGCHFYDGLGRDVPAFRLVLWSWPAERIRGMNAVDNFRVKMVRSEKQGVYLASLIGLLDPGVPLSLTGHSIGCRTVCAALEGLASGEIAGEVLPPPIFTGPRVIQAGLLVPSFDPRYLWQAGRYGNALSQVESMLVAYNPHDRLLRAYARVISPWALGLNGMPQPERLGENQHKLVEVSSRPWVHSVHRFSRYARSRKGHSWMRRYFFYEQPPTRAFGPLLSGDAATP